jgi:hypothetical protein
VAYFLSTWWICLSMKLNIRKSCLQVQIHVRYVFLFIIYLLVCVLLSFFGKVILLYFGLFSWLLQVEEEESLRPNMCALAILSCRPNSHPFQERHISLHEPQKIGRSVARARPTASNGIFDCKVLSRHHAMLWFENEKVWNFVDSGHWF